MSALITSYADALRQSLAFDPHAAERLAAEVEDHLAEAVANDTTHQPSEAARRAIRRFGSPHDIAAAYTREHFPLRVQAALRFALPLGGLVLLSMWLRNGLAALPAIAGPETAERLAHADDLGFRVAIALTALAWVVSRLGRSGHRLRTTVLALSGSAVAATVSVAAGGLLAAASLADQGLSATTAGWSASALLSVVLLGGLIHQLRILKGYADLSATPPHTPTGRTL